MLRRVERGGFVMPAHERFVLPEVGLDPGVGPAFEERPANGPHEPWLDPQSEREPGEKLVGQLGRVLVAQEGGRGQAGGFPGQDRPEPGELIAAAVGMAGNNGQRGIRVCLEPAAPFQPHLLQPIPLFLLTRQAAEIT